MPQHRPPTGAKPFRGRSDMLLPLLPLLLTVMLYTTAEAVLWAKQTDTLDGDDAPGESHAGIVIRAFVAIFIPATFFFHFYVSVNCCLKTVRATIGHFEFFD